MFILRDLLRSLQTAFSNTDLGRERAHLFVFTLLAIIVPFTSSITLQSVTVIANAVWSRNHPPALLHLHGLTPCLPWGSLWQIIWQLIPDPLTDGRLLVALDDSVNNKCGRTIFGCGFFHDHTAKLNQPSYPWSQDHCVHWITQTYQGTLVLFAVGLSILSDEEND